MRAFQINGLMNYGIVIRTEGGFETICFVLLQAIQAKCPRCGTLCFQWRGIYTDPDALGVANMEQGRVPVFE